MTLSPKNSHSIALEVSRRGLLKAGVAGWLGLPQILTAAEAEPRRVQKGKAKSVIFLFLSGGLSQIDTFDLKPQAPEGIRSAFQPIATDTPGVQICEHLPQLAARSKRWSLCRSLTHPYNEHSQGHLVMMTGRTPLPTGFSPSQPRATDWPCIASIAGRMCADAEAQLPAAAMLPEVLVHRTGRTIPGQFAGEMGTQWDPWLIKASPYNPTTYGAYPEYGFHHERGKEHPEHLAFQAPNVSLQGEMTSARLDGRLKLLSILEEPRRDLEEFAQVAQFSRQRRQAVSLLTDPSVREVFDVTGADEATQARYGKNQFGWSLLMARRLVAAGTRLVQVNLGNNETWDNHQSLFPNLQNFLLPPLDRAISALLDDLEASGQLDETLIVMVGEFGRTPRLSKLSNGRLPGRDHWGAVQTAFFAGGGIEGGRIVGASDKTGGHPADNPQTPETLAATIYHALGLPSDAYWLDGNDRPHFIYHGAPIEGL